MHEHCLPRYSHDHAFGQEAERPGERRTRWVIGLTAAMMAVEIVAGLAYGSMALLADGLHMASHTAALGLAAFAYAYARRHARDERYSFGTGKVNALGGFSGALLLLVFASAMAVESVARLLHPVTVDFGHALAVAVAGLLVNAVSAVILQHDEQDHAQRHDHNLRSAYLHVLADALTSVLAIGALLAGMRLGWVLVDPLMGVLGGLLVARWSLSLMRDSAAVLLDRRAPPDLLAALKLALEREGDQVCDLHVWRVAPEGYAAIVGLLSDVPREPDEYKRRLPADLPLRHVTVEVHPCVHAPAQPPAA